MNIPNIYKYTYICTYIYIYICVFFKKNVCAYEYVYIYIYDYICVVDWLTPQIVGEITISKPRSHQAPLFSKIFDSPCDLSLRLPTTLRFPDPGAWTAISCRCCGTSSYHRVHKHIPKHHWKIITWHYWITLVGCWFLPSFRLFGQRYRWRGMVPRFQLRFHMFRHRKWIEGWSSHAFGMQNRAKGG